MSMGERFILGINTTIIGMLVVFIVLVFLSYIIGFQSKILQKLVKTQDKKETNDIDLKVDFNEEYETIEKTGFTSGEATVVDADDETVAAILASVSFDADIPLNELKIKSIKPIIDKN
ncbi:OadG family protein [Caldicellulosiruptoraceae bacterium PP1]